MVRPGPCPVCTQSLDTVEVGPEFYQRITNATCVAKEETSRQSKITALKLGVERCLIALYGNGTNVEEDIQDFLNYVIQDVLHEPFELNRLN